MKNLKLVLYKLNNIVNLKKISKFNKYMLSSINTNNNSKLSNSKKSYVNTINDKKEALDSKSIYDIKLIKLNDNNIFEYEKHNNLKNLTDKENILMLYPYPCN